MLFICYLNPNKALFIRSYTTNENMNAQNTLNCQLTDTVKTPDFLLLTAHLRFVLLPPKTEKKHLTPL
jgi:hypothetical protein